MQIGSIDRPAEYSSYILAAIRSVSPAENVYRSGVVEAASARIWDHLRLSLVCQGQHLALTVLCVPCLLDSGWLSHMIALSLSLCRTELSYRFYHPPADTLPISPITYHPKADNLPISPITYHPQADTLPKSRITCHPPDFADKSNIMSPHSRQHNPTAGGERGGRGVLVRGRGRTLRH